MVRRRKVYSITQFPFGEDSRGVPFTGLGTEATLSMAQLEKLGYQNDAKRLKKPGQTIVVQGLDKVTIITKRRMNM